jgi:hypothetical protein
MPSCLTPAAASRFALRRSGWDLERSTGMVLAARGGHWQALFEDCIKLQSRGTAVGMLHLKKTDIVTIPSRESGKSTPVATTEWFRRAHSLGVSQRAVSRPPTMPRSSLPCFGAPSLICPRTSSYSPTISPSFPDHPQLAPLHFVLRTACIAFWVFRPLLASFDSCCDLNTSISGQDPQQARQIEKNFFAGAVLVWRASPCPRW